jgi:hypothetical protein
MTISSLKQRKIITLAQQGLSIPEIAKKTGTSYKTAKKYANQPILQVQPTPVYDQPRPRQKPIRVGQSRPDYTHIHVKEPSHLHYYEM